MYRGLSEHVLLLHVLACVLLSVVPSSIHSVPCLDCPCLSCGHRYEKMSTDQPDEAYQVTATSHWVVEWTGGGQSGTIEFDLTTDALPIRIGEAQVLTQ